MTSDSILEAVNEAMRTKGDGMGGETTVPGALTDVAAMIKPKTFIW